MATNIQRLRRNSGLDIDELATATGITAAHLAALEAGRATPSLRSLWALADAFAVPFGVLLAGAACETATFHVLRTADSRIVGARGSGFRSRTLSAAGDPREPDAYEVTIVPGWTEDAAAHAPETFEHIVVIDGTLTLYAGADHATLTRGDAVFFRADRRHRYVNPGPVETILHLTMIYAGDGPNPGIF